METIRRNPQQAKAETKAARMHLDANSWLLLAAAGMQIMLAFTTLAEVPIGGFIAQGGSVFTDPHLRAWAMIGALAGALIQVCISPPRNDKSGYYSRVLASQLVASWLSGYFLVPLFLKCAGLEADVNNAVLVAVIGGIFTSRIIKKTFPLVEKLSAAELLPAFFRRIVKAILDEKSDSDGGKK